MLTPEQLVASSIPHALLDDASDLHFAIRIGKRHIGAAVCDISENKVKWLFSETLGNSDDWSDALQFIKHKNWKEATYRKISISFDSDACTLIPTGFYESSRADELLSVLYRNHPSGETRTTDVSLFGAKLLFRIPDEIMEIASWFHHASIFPSMHAFLGRHFETPQHGPVIALQYDGDYMILRISEGKKLIFCNFFKIQHDEDVLYYLTNACMNLNISMSGGVLYTEGIDSNGRLMELLEKYSYPRISEPIFNHLPETVSPGNHNLTLQNFICAS